MKFIFLIIFSTLILTGCSNKEAAVLYLTQAQNSFAKKDFNSSLKDVKNALKQDSSLVEAKLLEGKIYYFTEKNIEAETVFKKLISKNPEFTDAEIYYIRCLIAQNKLTEAEQTLKNALRYNSQDWRLYYLYSVLAGKTDRQDLRLAMCRNGEKTLKASEQLYMEMSDIWLTLGLNSKAVEYLDKAETVGTDAGEIKKLKRLIKKGEAE